MSWTAMASAPAQIVNTNGAPLSGGVLKAYLPGTTTVTSIATDAAGSSLQTSLTANAAGFWEVSSNEVIPHIDRKCKWGIFANAADAAANTPFFMGPFDNVNQIGFATVNRTEHELGSDAAADSHAGISTGHIVRTNYHDSNRIAASGGEFRFNGTTTAGKAGNWPDPDGHFYDAAGQMFDNIDLQKTPERFGARADGVVDDSAAFTALSALANEGNGLWIVGRSEATYNNNINQVITGSHVVIDFAGAQLTSTSSSTRISFDGDSGTDGDRSSAVQGPVYCNVRHTGLSRGPVFKWCDGGRIFNIERDNDDGTFLNILYCRGTRADDIRIHNGEYGSTFGALVLHSDSTVIDRFVIDGGTHTYGIQIKGGRNNTVQNSFIRGITNMDIAFRDRGDAPYGVSQTTGTYPYATGAWGSADANRESRGTTFINCHAIDNDGNGFVSQEAQDSKVIDCYAEGNVLGFVGINTSGGDERNYFYIRCHAVANSSRGFDIAGDGVSDTLSGVVLEDCESEGHTSSDGMRLSHLQKPVITNPVVRNNTAQNGLNVVDCVEPRILNVRGSGNSNDVLVNLANVTNSWVFMDGGVADDVVSPYPGIYKNLDGLPTIQTTAATVTTLSQFDLDNGYSYRITAEVLGVNTTDNEIGSFTVQAVCSATGGTATLAASQDVHTAVNPSSLGGLTFSASGDSILLRVAGASSKTVEWRLGSVETVRVAHV